MPVAVIGSGQIGRTVAHAICESEPVILIDNDSSSLASARDDIRRVAAARRLRGASPLAPEQILDRLVFSDSLGDAAAADVVVENITEDRAMKMALHDRLDTMVDERAIIAVNTSVIPITTFESQYEHHTRLVGLHFMNPATEIRAVELVPSASTRPDVLVTIRQRLHGWGFNPLELRRDVPGFVINRILMQVVNEAADLVDTGVADALTVDSLFQSCLGHRTGPLATADLIGLDTVVNSLDNLAALVDDDRYRPSPMLRRLVREGRTGRKAGAGFHVYGGADDTVR